MLSLRQLGALALALAMASSAGPALADDVTIQLDVGDSLTLSATLSGSGALPSWLTLTPATALFSGTPLNGDVGTISVEVTADDGNGGTAATDTFDIVIANSNKEE